MDTTDQVPAVPDQPDSPPPARRSLWRPVLAGGVAGGVLAASVAVPVTWQLVDAPAPTPDGSAEAPTMPDEPGQWDPPWRPDPASQSAGTTATEDQSRGVLLLESSTGSGSGAGTGLVLSSSGLALTNYHVVQGSSALTATVAATGDEYDVEVLGFDETADVALLQLVDAEDLDTVDVDDDGAEIEDEVTAVGNALGRGTLLAVDGTITDLDGEVTTRDRFGPAADQLDGMIETDAPVVRGYSGGPMYDDEGEVVGITTAAAGNASESFAVPIDDALEIAGQIEDGDEDDSVQIGPSAYLGITAAETGSGAGVADVEEGGPADAAGLTPGSVISAIDGTEVTAVEDLLAALDDHEPGDEVRVTWSDADGQRHRAEVTLGESPVS